jgi:hypothetical protein
MNAPVARLHQGFSGVPRMMLAIALVEIETDEMPAWFKAALWDKFE